MYRMKLGLEKRNLPKIVSSGTIFKRMKSVMKIKKEKKKEKKERSLIKKYSKILILIEKLFAFMFLLKTFVKGMIILLWSRAEFLIK